jgi:hypothetical protein
MKPFYHRLISLISILAISSIWASIVFAQNETPQQNDDRLEKVIEGSKILTPGYPIRAVVRNDEGFVSTYRNPNASENDCKIDAVLITRKVIEAKKPVRLTKVQVDFYHPDELTKGSRVIVTDGDIKLYSQRKVNTPELLSLLAVTPIEAPIEKLTPRQQPQNRGRFAQFQNMSAQERREALRRWAANHPWQIRENNYLNQQWKGVGSQLPGSTN